MRKDPLWLGLVVQPSWTVCIVVLIFLMLMALFSSVLRMQDFCTAGIDALFPWCAEKAKFLCTWMKCPKICIIFNFIQNSELTCFLAIFWYAFGVLLSLVFPFVVKIFLALCPYYTPLLSLWCPNNNLFPHFHQFSSFPGGQVVSCTPYSVFLPKTLYAVQARHSWTDVFSACLT